MKTLVLHCLVVWFLVLGVLGCAARYDKATGNYTGALACVDVSVAGVFTWKCTEQSQVPALPDSQKPGP